MNDCYAVLTGDLVRSRSLSATELHRAHAGLREAVADLKDAAWEPRPAGEVDIFRGDSWQLLLRTPGNALRTAVYLRASLLAQGFADTRIGLGIGGVASLSRERTSLSTGEAFELSGAALDGLGPRFRLGLAAAPDPGLPAPWAEVAVHLCDSVMAQWEGRQIETGRLACYYPDASHKHLGSLLTPPVTQQAVSKSLQSAGWYGLAEALDAFETELGK
ncbi:hypothetical protein [Thiohalorhabdus methylotrophus]|uniref:SatD family protein n=1 Tax=Thiohalorhabdus methylotrophus TaxID=3242694 RepID=A0ABV4TRW0_9GAMM